MAFGASTKKESGRTLAVSRTGDESHLGKQNGSEALQFLIIYLLQLVEDAVSCLRHFAGIIAALDFEETAETLSSLRKAIRKFLAQHRLSFCIKRTVLCLRRGFIGCRRGVIGCRKLLSEAPSESVFLRRMMLLMTPSSIMVQSLNRVSCSMGSTDRNIASHHKSYHHIFSRRACSISSSETSESALTHELQSSLIALVLAVAAYAAGAQVPAPCGR